MCTSVATFVTMTIPMSDSMNNNNYKYNAVRFGCGHKQQQQNKQKTIKNNTTLSIESTIQEKW